MSFYGTASSCSPSKRVRHRCKGHRANIWRRPGAKHCSSLCEQSEGANIAAAKHELKIQRRYAPERWLYSLRVRGPHFASKVSYNAGASDLRRMFAQRLLLLCRTCYANLQMMVGLALENNPKSGKSHKYRKIPQIIVNFVGKGTEGQWVSHWNLLR